MNLRNLFLVVLDDRTLRFGYNMGVLWWGSSTDSETAYSWFIVTGHKERDRMPWLLFMRPLIPSRISCSWSNVSNTLSPKVITLGLQIEDKHFGMAQKPLLLAIISVCEQRGCISPDLVSALLSALHGFILCPTLNIYPSSQGLILREKSILMLQLFGVTI